MVEEAPERYEPIHDVAVVTEGFARVLEYCEQVREGQDEGVLWHEHDDLRGFVDGLYDASGGALGEGWAEKIIDMVKYLAYADGVVYECAKAICYCIERGGMVRHADRLFVEMDAFVTGYRDDADDDDWNELSDEEEEDLTEAVEELDSAFGGVIPTGWVKRFYRMARATPAGAEGDCFSEIVRAMGYCAGMRYIPGDEDVRFVEEFRGPLPSAGLEVAIWKVAREFSGAGPLVSPEFVEVILGDIGGKDENEWGVVLRLCVDGMGFEELEEAGIDARMRLVLREVVEGARGTEQALAVFMWRCMYDELSMLAGDPELAEPLLGVRGVSVDENMGELLVSVAGGAGEAEEFWRNWSLPVKRQLRAAHPAMGRLTVWDNTARVYGDGATDARAFGSGDGAAE